MTNPQLPKDAIAEIERGVRYWRDSDKDRWNFAEVADSVVGKYIPYATELLAKKITRDVSSVQGYAKAHKLKLALGLMKFNNHQAPLPNIDISHYIVCGKAFFAKDSKWKIEEIDKLLREANTWGKPVSWLRNKLGNMTDEDAYINSVHKTIQNLEAHIINTSYFGVSDRRAVIAAKIAGMLIRALRWVIDSVDDSGLEIKEYDVDSMVEISENIFHVEVKAGSHE